METREELLARIEQLTKERDAILGAMLCPEYDGSCSVVNVLGDARYNGFPSRAEAVNAIRAECGLDPLPPEAQ